MKAGFVTCVRLGLECMEEIYRVGGTLDLIVTLPDDRASGKSGRIYVDEFADRHGIDVVKSPSVNDPGVVREVRDRELDWLLIIGWSQIARRAVLEAPAHGCLGIHPTLLPAGRGRASIPWAILKGLPETGVTMFQLDEGVDTGPIVASVRIPLAPDERASTLYDKVCAAHRSLIAGVWPDLVAGRITPVPQDESLATVWPGRRPEDGLVHPGMSVTEGERMVRAVTSPYPGAFWELPDGGRLRIWAAATQPGSHEGAVRLQLADGPLYATDYEIEPPAPA